MAEEARRDSDSKHTILRCRRLSNEQIFDLESQTLSIEQKQNVRKSGDESIIDAHSDTYKTKNESENKKSCCDELKKQCWYPKIGIFLLFSMSMMIVFVYQNEFGFRQIIEAIQRQLLVGSLDEEWDAFSTAFPNSLLFGPKGYSESRVNFRAFWDAQIIVLDLDNCLYYATKEYVTYGHQHQESFRDMSSRRLDGTLVWNHEFEYLIKNGLLDNKQIYFYSAAKREFLTAQETYKDQQIASLIERKFEAHGTLNDIYLKKEGNIRKSCKDLARVKGLQSGSGQKALVMDNNPLELRKNFNLRRPSKLYGQQVQQPNGFPVMINKYF